MTDCLRIGSLSGSSLKVIAIVSMTIDHLGLYMLGGDDPASASVTYHLMRMVGRLAFPIFAFLLVEGYVHTHNIRRYIMNLLMAAIISDIPWMLLGGYDSHNVMFTLLLGLMAVSFIDRFWRNRIVTLTVISLIGVTDRLLMAGHLPDMCPVHLQGQTATGIHVRPAVPDGLWPCRVCRWADDADAVLRSARLCHRMGIEVFLLCLLSAAPDDHLASAIVSWQSGVP